LGILQDQVHCLKVVQVPERNSAQMKVTSANFQRLFRQGRYTEARQMLLDLKARPEVLAEFDRDLNESLADRGATPENVRQEKASLRRKKLRSPHFDKGE
jgi:hypothetical protein